MVMTRLLFQMELFLFFIRKKFTLNDIDNIQSLILDVDYDDAFVAYINGIEIGRKNIGGNPHSIILCHTDQYEIYRNGKPDRITISNLEGIINSGENIFSLQAHNVSNTSSNGQIDYIPFLSVSLSDSDNDEVYLLLKY